MILLVTPDDALRRHLASVLGSDDAVVCCDLATAFTQAPDPVVSLTVFDCRIRADARATLVRHRLVANARSRCVAIAPRQGGNPIHAITWTGNQVLDAVIPGTDSVADVVRAHLNDPTKTTAAATALELLLRILPAPTHETVSIVIGSGFRIGSVKRLSAYWGMSRSHVEKALQTSARWTPSELIDIAKATYAIILFAQHDQSREAVAQALSFAKESSLDDAILRALGAPWDAIRYAANRPGAVAWLTRRLHAATAAHQRRRGGGAPQDDDVTLGG